MQTHQHPAPQGRGVNSTLLHREKQQQINRCILHSTTLVLVRIVTFRSLRSTYLIASGASASADFALPSAIKDNGRSLYMFFC